MAKIKLKKLFGFAAIAPFLIVGISASAQEVQTPTQTLLQTSAPAQSAPSSNTETLIPAPAPELTTQDVTTAISGQSQNIPLSTQKPFTITEPSTLEKAMGIDVPDILKPTNAPQAIPSNQAPIIAPPKRAPTPNEIAREIAPNFNVATQYTRLTQCYGTADFMAAFMRVRANRPGAAPQLRAVADQISGMKGQMQPFVLAASTVRTEARFRADYDRVAKNISAQIARARNPDAVIQTQLRTLDTCSRDVNRWRGGR